jgi:hypothetical protein
MRSPGMTYLLKGCVLKTPKYLEIGILYPSNTAPAPIYTSQCVVIYTL